MFHLDYLKERGLNEDTFVKRAAGRFYTGEVVGRRLATEAAVALHQGRPNARSVSIVDPFAGDGRLVEWLIDAWIQFRFPSVQWNISLWDLDEVGFESARTRLNSLVTRSKVNCKAEFKVVDSFAEALTRRSAFDLVITNPPWEILKPDRRELEAISPSRRARYISRMRAYDEWLGENFPLSRPKRKFAGWGTNLSRVGFEASLLIARKGGIVASVLPASFLADDQTGRLREHMLVSHTLRQTTYYPAESKLYEFADVASIATTLVVGGAPATCLPIHTHNPRSGQVDKSTITLNPSALRRVDYVIPISFGSKSMAVLERLAQRFPTWLELELGGPNALWAGRELDETGIARWLQPALPQGPLFVKGRMIGRYMLIEAPSHTVVRPGWRPPSSTSARRIAWRDVSRPSQKRRMIATLIDAGFVAGNSLGVAYFKDCNELPLLALLGVMNSTCFEFQLRAHLATSHVSLSSLRKVAVPSLAQLRKAKEVADMVRDALAKNDAMATKIDAFIAKHLYGLTEEEYRSVLESFTTLTPLERLDHLNCFRDLHALKSRSTKAAKAKEYQHPRDCVGA